MRGFTKLTALPDLVLDADRSRFLYPKGVTAPMLCTCLFKIFLYTRDCYWLKNSSAIGHRSHSEVPPPSCKNKGYKINFVFAESYPCIVVIENGKSSPEVLIILAISIEENAVVLFQLRQDILPAPKYDSHTRLLAPSCRRCL